MTPAARPALLEPGAHVCIVLMAGLGDAVHALPLVNAIRRAAPDVTISFVDSLLPAGLLRAHPAIDRMLVFDPHAGVKGLVALRRVLREQPIDVTLNLCTYLKGAVPAVMSRAPVRVGFRRGIARDLAWLANTRTIASAGRRHTQDLFLEFLDVIGVPAEPVEWRLEPTAQERERQAEFFAAHAGRAIAAVVPASSKTKKDWVPERWVELVDRLDRECGLMPMLLGGPGQRETALGRMIAESALTDVLWAMEDGVRRLVWRIAASRIVIAPDTAAIHIARALGVPAVGLYGHTNPWRVGPWRAYEDLWIDRYTEPGAAPDPASFTPKHGRMEGIRTDEVMEKVRHALAAYPVRA